MQSEKKRKRGKRPEDQHLVGLPGSMLEGGAPVSASEHSSVPEALERSEPGEEVPHHKGDQDVERRGNKVEGIKMSRLRSLSAPRVRFASARERFRSSRGKSFLGSSIRDILGEGLAENLKVQAKVAVDTIFNRKHYIVAGVSFTTGFSNVVTYIRYNRIYLTILTGNMIEGVTALVEGESEGVILSVSVCLGYFFGAFTARFSICEMQVNENLLTPVVFVLMTSLVYFARRDAGIVDDVVAVVLFSFAMGIVNTITSHLDKVSSG